MIDIDKLHKEIEHLKKVNTEDFELLSGLIDELLNNPLKEVENGKYALVPHTAYDIF
ncbi:MAG: hypothetical protein ACKPKO_61520 [Candidatus Fonsibacter sp.]